MEYTANYCTLSKLNPMDSICCSRSSPSAFLPTSSPSFPLSLLPFFPPLTLSFMYVVIALCTHVEIREPPSGVRPLLSLCGTWHWTQVSKLGDSPFLQWVCSFALILFLFYPHKSSLHHLLLIIYYGVCWLNQGGDFRSFCGYMLESSLYLKNIRISHCSKKLFKVFVELINSPI